MLFVSTMLRGNEREQVKPCRSKCQGIEGKEWCIGEGCAEGCSANTARPAGPTPVSLCSALALSMWGAEGGTCAGSWPQLFTQNDAGVGTGRQAGNHPSHVKLQHVPGKPVE